MPSKILVPFVLSLAVLTPGPAALADGDPAAGERVFRRCLPCHRIMKDRNMDAGLLNLYGVIGNKAGTVDKVFTRYSAALRNSGIVWTEENLDKYLANPADFIPGNKMFNGTRLKKPQDRANVIAYIKQRSQE